MNKRLPLLIRHVMFNLQGGFLVRPLVIALTLGCAGALLSWLEETFPGFSDWVPLILFPSHADPGVAQAILQAIATSIMTVVSIVFAILLMTLTLASMQFSPRIIVSFAKDQVTQWTLGIFLGTFCYCMAALPAAHTLPKPFSPIATVLGAMVLAIACVALLLFFIHHISQAISVNHIVDRIAAETEAVIDQIMPLPRQAVHLEEAPPLRPDESELAIVSETSGYIRFIETAQLVAIAKHFHVSLRVLRRVGQFVPAGAPLVMVSKPRRVSPEGLHGLRGAFDFGPTRTLQQDVEFGVLQIVDIALKAISPAVNDPSTAITCVDQLSRILIRFVSREPQSPLLYDPPGIVRVSVIWIPFDRLLRSAFEQIRMYSKMDVAVSLRLLRALGDIAATTPEPGIQQYLVGEGERIVAGCAEKLSDEDLRHVRRRLSALQQLSGIIPEP